MPWQYLIVDEAHRLKNVESRLRVAVQGLDAQQMALLTGTPVQNSTAELFSLLNLLDPARFGDADDFEERYGDMHSAEQAKRRLRLRSSWLGFGLGLAPAPTPAPIGAGGRAAGPPQAADAPPAQG